MSEAGTTRRAWARAVRLAVAAGVVALAAACAAGTPYTYVPADSGKKGPGLFSGQDGKVVLYRR